MSRVNSKIATAAFLGMFGMGLVVGCAVPATATLSATPTIAATSTTSAAQIATPTSSTAQVQSSARLNLNTATDAQLLGIPSMGSKMLREFLEYRPYTSIEQFRREIGKYVSADQVAAYEKYVYVPVDPNAATAATLQQIPGVDAAIAQLLIASRPYASNEAFLAKLGQYVTSEQATAASGYLK